jgi:hypothetical protein
MVDELLFQHETIVFDMARDHFETLREFLSLSSENLAKEYSDYVDSKEKEQKTWPMAILEGFYHEDYIDNYLGGLGKYSRTFPKLMLYSIMIMACSSFEKNMQLVCRVMNHFKRTQLEWEKMKGSVVDKTARLVETLGFKMDEIRPTLAIIRDYCMVRNCIVHEGGSIEGRPKTDRLMKHAIESGLLPDEFSEESLVLTQSYCERVCDTFSSFFLDLSLKYPNSSRSQKSESENN